VVEPEGQYDPAVHGPLQVSSVSLSAHPNLPAGQGLAVPFIQNELLGQGIAVHRVLGEPPSVYSPGTASVQVGAALPTGQYTLSAMATPLPHSTWWAVTAAPVQ
jgi:hypothetical protein